MKKLLLLLMLVLSFGVGIDAQVMFQRSFLHVNTVFTAPDIAWSAIDRTYVVAQVETQDSTTYSTHVRVMKLDSTGYPIWTQQFTFGDSTVINVTVTVSNNGNIYCGGEMSGQLSPCLTYFIVNFAPWGTINWSKRYLTASTTPYDRPDLKVLSNGNLLFTESVYGHIGFFKTDASGNLIQAESIREDTTVENKTPGFSSAVLNDGSFLFTGKRNSDIAVVHTDPNGQIIWSTLLNTSSYYHAKNIVALSDGSSIVCGSEMNTHPFLVRLDANGNKVWYKQFDQALVLYDIQAIDDSTFYISGEDVFAGFSIAKIDGDGNVLSVLSLANDPNNYYAGTRMIVNPDGMIALGCTYSHVATASSNVYYMFTDQLSPNGCMLVSDSLTLSTGTSSADPAVVVMPLYATPQPITVAVGNPTLTNASQNYLDYCWVVSVPDQHEDGLALNLQNSPVDKGGSLSFTLGEYTGEFTYSVYDQLGREVVTQQNRCSSGELIPVSPQATRASGMYTLVVTTGDKQVSARFVVY